jgi:DNA-binding XRE family transcriptional regulator
MKPREYSDEELLADIRRIKEHPEIPDAEEKERDAYFNDPANAEKVAETMARMRMVMALHKARQQAGLTQAQLAEKLGTKQTAIAQIERGRRNITFATIQKYAAACGKRVSITLV